LQLSFKFRMWSTDDRRRGLWAAYSQMSQWQVYNSEISRPFRETNYMPELMVSFRRDIGFGGFDRRLLNVGYNHQSNGRFAPILRSWDRIIASIGIERGNFALVLRPWVRIDEGDSDDDNPDITDYFGSRNRLKAQDRTERSPHRRRPA
jgi:phospholipase A1/A2